MLLLLNENEDEKIVASQAPSMVKFLKKDSKAHYTKFKEYLDILNIDYEEDHRLVSKNDYSTNSIWKFE
jgi:histidyl-tRNA synthetase